MPCRPLFSTLALSLFLGNAQALTSFDLHNINKVHESGITGNGVNVAIVDTIFNKDHELLKGQITALFTNTTTQNRNHGNLVAGIAAGNKSNKTSYGVAYGSKIVAFGDVGWAFHRPVWDVRNLYKAADYNVRVINNSHQGGNDYTTVYTDLVNKHDILIVYAAGNSGLATPTGHAKKGTGSPNNLGAWLVAGNLNSEQVTRGSDGKLTVRFSALDTGTHICNGATAYCVFAAGTRIYTSNYAAGSYGSPSGTSMAAPLVTGVAALVAEKYPFLGGKQIADIILSTANKDFVVTGTSQKWKTYSEDKREYYFGQGIVDAEKALKGLSLLDVNRLSADDVANNTAFYTINTKGYNTLFENDIAERQWDDKYHTENTSAAKATLQAALKDKHAGLKKTGDGTLALSGDLLYLGPTLIAEGEIALVGGDSQIVATEIQQTTKTAVAATVLSTRNAVTARNATSPNALTVAGDLETAPEATLSVQTDVDAQQNLKNQGTLKVGTQHSPHTLSVGGDFENSGQLAVLSTENNTSHIEVGGTYTQTGGNFDAGYLKVSGDSASNNALNANAYNITGGTVTYTPRSASGVSRTLPLSLNGMENNLQNARVVLLADAHALNYTLSATNNALLVAAKPNLYADFDGANTSLARLLIQISDGTLSTDYETFFETLNAADFATYRSALVDLNDLSHLQYNNLLLGIQNQDILEKIVNLQTESEGVFLRPRYAHLKAGLKAHRAGFEFYANKNTAIGGLSAFINYDNLSGSDVSSQLVSFGTGLRNTATPLGIFGGVRLGFANNTVKKTQQLKYKTRSASLFAGIDKDFAVGSAHLIPTFYVDYHYFHQEKFHHAGISYRGTTFFNNLQTNNADYSGNNLFARNVHAKNSNFVSANLGVTFKQNLAQTWNLGIHGFYERRLLGDKFKSTARFTDFGGDFEQTLKLSQNFFRLGFDLNYESPINARGIGYFASVGVDYEISEGGTDRYRAYGADLKGGIKF